MIYTAPFFESGTRLAEPAPFLFKLNLSSVPMHLPHCAVVHLQASLRRLLLTITNNGQRVLGKWFILKWGSCSAMQCGAHDTQWHWPHASPAGWSLTSGVRDGAGGRTEAAESSSLLASGQDSWGFSAYPAQAIIKRPPLREREREIDDDYIRI